MSTSCRPSHNLRVRWFPFSLISILTYQDHRKIHVHLNYFPPCIYLLGNLIRMVRRCLGKGMFCEIFYPRHFVTPDSSDTSFQILYIEFVREIYGSGSSQCMPTHDGIFKGIPDDHWEMITGRSHSTILLNLVEWLTYLSVLLKGWPMPLAVLWQH